ncbi:MAG: CopG family transcriptional regulator [Anaerolineaceae bacterium]|nr:CopG family transcriptional regulator [Anaerolineaceae bacterium]
MTERATFTLDDEAYAFLKVAAGRNRSAYINQLLMDEKKRLLAEKVLAANREEAEDSAYQDALAEWDDTLSDGLNP